MVARSEDFSAVGPLLSAWMRSLSLCWSKGKGANSARSALFLSVVSLQVRSSTSMICETV